MYHTSPLAEDPLAPFLRRLAFFGAPVDLDLSGLADWAGAAERHRRNTDLTARPGAGLEIVLAGWGCTMWPDAARRRQIFSFVLPGDVLGSFWRKPAFTFCQVVALTPMTTVPADALLATRPEGGFAHPEVVHAARQGEDHAHHLLIDQMLRLGGRDAYAGIAHLLLELHDRLHLVGLATGGVFHLPVGQRVLAQALGFSVVHTNTTIQKMVADGLFTVENEHVSLLQPGAMAQLSGFVGRHSGPRHSLS